MKAWMLRLALFCCEIWRCRPEVGSREKTDQVTHYFVTFSTISSLSILENPLSIDMIWWTSQTMQQIYNPSVRQGTVYMLLRKQQIEHISVNCVTKLETLANDQALSRIIFIGHSCRSKICTFTMLCTYLLWILYALGSSFCWSSTHSTKQQLNITITGIHAHCVCWNNNLTVAILVL